MIWPVWDAASGVAEAAVKGVVAAAAVAERVAPVMAVEAAEEAAGPAARQPEEEAVRVEMERDRKSSPARSLPVLPRHPSRSETNARETRAC